MTTDDRGLDERARSAVISDLLRVVSPAQLDVIVHRCERTFPAWSLAGHGPIHDRVLAFLGGES